MWILQVCRRCVAPPLVTCKKEKNLPKKLHFSPLIREDSEGARRDTHVVKKAGSIHAHGVSADRGVPEF